MKLEKLTYKELISKNKKYADLINLVTIDSFMYTNYMKKLIDIQKEIRSREINTPRMKIDCRSGRYNKRPNTSIKNHSEWTIKEQNLLLFLIVINIILVIALKLNH